MEDQLAFFSLSTKPIKLWLKKRDSQSGGSIFTTPGSEGLLVIEKNGKPIGVTHPQLEISV